MTPPDLSYLDCNCFAIRQAARFVSQLYERHVSQAGVTAVQFTHYSRQFIGGRA